MISTIDIQTGINYVWILSLAFVLLNISFTLIFPKYNLSRFINIPDLKYINVLNKLLYYFFLLLTIFKPIEINTITLITGILFYISGIVFYTMAMFAFAISAYNEPVISGIYRYSRHPIYVSFLFITIGIAVTAQSGLLFLLALLHFITSLFIIFAEEKNCADQYGQKYIEYKKRTRMLI